MIVGKWTPGVNGWNSNPSHFHQAETATQSTQTPALCLPSSHSLLHGKLNGMKQPTTVYVIYIYIYIYRVFFFVYIYIFYNVTM